MLLRALSDGCRTPRRGRVGGSRLSVLWALRELHLTDIADATRSPVAALRPCFYPYLQNLPFAELAQTFVRSICQLGHYKGHVKLLPSGMEVQYDQS